MIGVETMPEIEDRGGLTDTLLKAAGGIILLLIGVVWGTLAAHQASTDTRIDQFIEKQNLIDNKLAGLAPQIDYQSHALADIMQRMTSVEQTIISTRDKEDAMEDKINRQQTNELERKYRTKARQDSVAMELQKKHHDHEVKALTDLHVKSAVVDP